ALPCAVHAAGPTTTWERPDLEGETVEDAVEWLRAAVELDASAVATRRRHADRAVALLGPGHFASELIADAVRGDAVQEPARLAAAYEALTFRPRKEGDMPPGFPAFTPVHAVELKQYPQYRVARADHGEGPDSAFFSLFGHIQRNSVKMTVPVEMRSAEGDASATMAFLYERPDQGATGTDAEDDRVEVVDVAPTTVLATGVRGRRREVGTEAAEARLNAWLAEHPDYAAAGPFRVMGYNSPFIPPDQQYFEVQVPVGRVE
ncbi:MAG: heme-binding protein, partial [Planctomycetota bacterium]